jgi:hypothetical protein
VANFRDILKDVRANLAQLNGCAGPHDFVPLEPEKPLFGRKWRCTLCGGVADSHAYHWYTLGVAHGTGKS